MSAQAQPSPGVADDLSERRRSRTLHSMATALEALATEVRRVATLGDQDAITALNAFDPAIESIQAKRDALLDEFEARIERSRDEETE